MFAILVYEANGCDGDEFMLGTDGDIMLYTTLDAAQTACAEFERNEDNPNVCYRVITFKI